MDGRYWSSVGVTGLNAAFDGALAYGSAQLTNVPHGRLAYGALLRASPGPTRAIRPSRRPRRFWHSRRVAFIWRATRSPIGAAGRKAR
jgi:hypothetical protein